MPTEAEKLKYLAANLDPNKTTLVCGRHNYTPGGPRMPTSECSDCWFAFLFHHIAQLPPNKQHEKIEELTVACRHAFEMEETGSFDFIPFKRPKMVVTKGTN